MSLPLLYQDTFMSCRHIHIKLPIMADASGFHAVDMEVRSLPAGLNESTVYAGSAKAGMRTADWPWEY